MSDVPVTENTKAPEPEFIQRAIQIGCNAAHIHLLCSYPACSCKQIPAAIIAAATPLMDEAQKGLS